MLETAKSTRLFRFGVFEVDAATGELRKQGMRIRLQEQPAQILLMLLHRAGEVVTREEICRKLWPAGTFVDFDQSLGTALRKLRQALDDDAETPRYVETVPKHGFRFVAPVQRISPPAPDSSLAPPVTTGESNSKTRANTALTRNGLWLLLAAILACALFFLIGRFSTSPKAETNSQSGHSGPSIRSSLLPPSGWAFEHSSFSVSPDGTRLAFVAVGPDGMDKLWIRTLSSANAQQLSGTEGALLPFWSPDSRRIGFFSGGRLSVVDLDNGGIRIICAAPFARGGGSWSSNGTIVFSPSVVGPLFRVAESGGVPSSVTRVANPSPGRRHMWPSFLADGTHFFYSESSGPADPRGVSIYLGALDGSAPKLILTNTTGNVAFASGYLLFDRDHTLWAQPFDPARLELTGAAQVVTTQEMDEELSFSHAEFSASQNGLLVFESLSDSASTLEWFDEHGKRLNEVIGSGSREPRLSPNGKLLAFASDDERNGKFFVRVFDLQRGVSMRLTNGGTDRSPAWSHDGSRVTFTTLHEIEDVPVDNSAPPRILLKDGVYLGHMDWSPNDELIFTDFSSGLPSLNIYSAHNRHVIPFATGAEGRFSPDGKWIAYVGPLTAPDADAIFVAPFPGPGGRIRISAGSGAQPVWSPDGRHLFYIAPDRKLMMVEFDANAKTASAPHVLFQTSIVAANFEDTQYAVSRDLHFLINSFSQRAAPLTLSAGWPANLQSNPETRTK